MSAPFMSVPFTSVPPRSVPSTSVPSTSVPLMSSLSAPGPPMPPRMVSAPSRTLAGSSPAELEATSSD